MSDNISGIINGKYARYEIIPPVFHDNHGNKKVKVRFIDTGTEKIARYNNAIRGVVKNPMAPGNHGIGLVDVPTRDSSGKRTKEYRCWEALIDKCYNPNYKDYNLFGGNNITICEKWRKLSGFIEDLQQMEGYSEWLNDSSYHLNCFIKSGRNHDIVMDLNNTILTNKASVKGKYIELDYSKIYYNSENEPYRIIAEEPTEKTKTGTNRYVTIQFLNTNSIKHHVQLSHAYRGLVKDNYSKKLFNNNGCIGNAKSRDPLTGKVLKSYEMWRNMMMRCYDNNNVGYNTYGGSGVTVCERWKTYEYFEKDLMYLDGYHEWKHQTKDNKYHMDKDLLQYDKLPSEKIYSPFTCALIPAIDNVLESNLRNNGRNTGGLKMPKRVMCIHRADISMKDRYKYHQPKELCRIVK